jgi:hypothetical protein
MNITRLEIREVLILYFKGQDFTEDQYTKKDKGSIDMMVSHLVNEFKLPSKYLDLKNNQRRALKKLVSQEIALMKKIGLCRRVTWGRYRPIS